MKGIKRGIKNKKGIKEHNLVLNTVNLFECLNIDYRKHTSIRHSDLGKENDFKFETLDSITPSTPKKTGDGNKTKLNLQRL